jgi:hypothetical protein
MKERLISEKMAATVTDAWLAGEVGLAFQRPQSEAFKAISSHLYEEGAFDKMALACFESKPFPFRNIVELAKEALFYHYKDQILREYDWRFDWPTYEYVSNFDNYDEE